MVVGREGEETTLSTIWLYSKEGGRERGGGGQGKDERCVVVQSSCIHIKFLECIVYDF